MSQQVIRNSKGIILYRTETHNGITKVYNIRNDLLGWCAFGKTRDSKGTLIALSESPGLLLNC